VFDITNRESFLSIDSWLEEIHKHVGDDVLIMVFANKSDLLEDPDQQEEIQVTE
jgi:GTPase SAR1 family protein